MSVTISDLTEALATLDKINSELAARLMPVIRPFTKAEGGPVNTPQGLRHCSPLVDQLRELENRLRGQIGGIQMLIDNLEI